VKLANVVITAIQVIIFTTAMILLSLQMSC